MSDIGDFRVSLKRALEEGDLSRTELIIKESLDSGTNPLIIVDEGLIPAIRNMGDLFEKGELFLPHLMRAAEAMKNGMAVLSPLLGDDDKAKATKDTVILGTVEGDIHDIGKNIVSLMLSAAGFNVIDLGASVSVGRFMDAVELLKEDVVIIGMSSLLTTTMIQQKKLMETLQAKGLRSQVKVMVGGACVSSEWMGEIGADGYGLNAQEAVKLAVNFISTNQG